MIGLQASRHEFADKACGERINFYCSTTTEGSRDAPLLFLGHMVYACVSQTIEATHRDESVVFISARFGIRRFAIRLQKLGILGAISGGQSKTCRPGKFRIACIKRWVRAGSYHQQLLNNPLITRAAHQRQ